MGNIGSASVIDQLLLLGDMLVSLVLGGLLGLERERAQKPAGVRTHMIVAVAATLLVGLIDPILGRISREVDPDLLRSDPIRIIEAVVTGISFIAAGSVIRSGANTVRGLTTAGSVLLSGGLGIAVGLRQYVLAVGLTGMALVILRLLTRLEVPTPPQADEGERADD